MNISQDELLALISACHTHDVVSGVEDEIRASFGEDAAIIFDYLMAPDTIPQNPNCEYAKKAQLYLDMTA